jgi:hypothetical protein
MATNEDQKNALISKGERLLNLHRTTSVDVEARPYIDDVLDYVEYNPEVKALFDDQVGTENKLLRAIEYLKNS